MVAYPSSQPPSLSLAALFLKFLRFGCLAFGGPVAQIAMLRQALVEKEGWIGSDRFNRLLAIMQVLPGPEAHELCVHFGMIARGRIGGVLAGLGFMLPGFALMMLCGWAYTALAQGGLATSGIFLGIQAAVLGIIFRAVHRIAGHILIGAALVGLAAIAFSATFAGVPFWVLLAGAGLAYTLATRTALVWAIAAAIAAAGFVLIGGGAQPPSAQPSTGIALSTLALFVAGLKGGLLTFGGAYTAIPYVRLDTVGRGWLSDASFLDGVAVAGLLPAPLVIFATFVGFVAGGWAGAIAITAGMFLPAFAFSLIFYERLEAVVENTTLHRMLDGVAAAVVGIIAATFIELGASTLNRTPYWTQAVMIFLAAAILAWRLKGPWVAPALIVSGAAAGLALDP